MLKAVLNMMSWLMKVKTVLFIEIQSSPMKETLGACVWKGSVLINNFVFLKKTSIRSLSLHYPV